VRVLHAGKPLPAAGLTEPEMLRENAGLVGVDLSRFSVVHVAGSKGKGSTCQMVEALLRARK